jgi:hypothetical protein
MTGTMVKPGPGDQKIMALNVRAFSGVDFDKIKIRYVDMKDEDPQYDVDAMPKLE